MEFHYKIKKLKEYRNKYKNYDEAVKNMIKNKIITEPSEVTGLTLEEIGYILGVSRERVRQIESNAFRKIRNHIMSNPKLREKFKDLI